MSIAGFPISAVPMAGLEVQSSPAASLSASASLLAVATLDALSSSASLSGTSSISASAFVAHAVFGDGEILIGGEAGVRVLADFSQPIEWQVIAYFDAVKEFRWDVGELPLKVYQVEGCCKPNSGDTGGCEILPVDTNDPLNCNQRFLQTIFASNLAGVCDFLTKTNWKWPICSIKKFSTEAAKLIADGVNIPPECNTLDEVEYCQIPECFEFCLHTDQSTYVGVFTEVIDNIFLYEGSGGIKLGGKAELLWEAEGSGGIITSGSADVLTSYHAASGSGGIVVSDEAVCKSSYFATQAVGGIVVAGESSIISPSWHCAGAGDIVVSGTADDVFRVRFSSTGRSNVYPNYAGINISGRAYYPIHVTPVGRITLGGAATCKIINFNYISTGGISIGGQACIVSPSWYYDGSGEITVAGSSTYTNNSWMYTSDTTPIVLGGDASCRNSIDGNFWYTAITSPITLGGDADCRVSQLKHKANASMPIVLAGVADITSSFVPTSLSYMGMGFGIEDLEMHFSLDGAQVAAIVPPSNVINTNCGECNQLSMQLNFKHNLEFGNVFREFMKRNGFEVPQTFSLFYSKRLNLWQGTLHYNGYASDNAANAESWRINVDWGCTKEYAEDVFASSVWKFSLLMTRKNINTGIDFDTRLLILFPSEDICVSADRDGLDFNFQYDTKKNYVSTRANLVVDVITLYDNIGLFKSKYWLTNKFNVRISEDLFQDGLDKNDISFILPSKQPQFAI